MNKKELQRQESNKRILDAAMIEFSKNNYQVATLTDIAVRADVSKGLVTLRFGSKAGLFLELVKLICEKELVFPNNPIKSFNDAVLDVRFQTSWPNGVETKEAIITLWAAGGTKNLTIAGKEVHELFGVPTNTMVNTNAANGKDGLAPVIFRVKTNATNAIDIPVKVGSIELTAKQGEATQKMAVAYGTKWMKERKIITGTYTDFQNYVRNNSPLDWYNTVSNTENLY